MNGYGVLSGMAAITITGGYFADLVGIGFSLYGNISAVGLFQESAIAEDKVFIRPLESPLA